jgi:hypothetical protein
VDELAVNVGDDHQLDATRQAKRLGPPALRALDQGGGLGRGLGVSVRVRAAQGREGFVELTLGRADVGR